MQGNDQRNAAGDLVYLASCALNGTVPDAARVGGMDLDALYITAQRHMMSAVACMALESAGIKDERFIQAKGKAIRKVATFDIEREAVMKALDEEGIWYMPLKGAVLKELYPAIGMREMSDNDILCDPARSDDIRKIMESLGFETDELYGRGVHDHFTKLPVCNFEMHRSLFGAPHDPRIEEYYRNVRERMVPAGCGNFSYGLSDEDFYIYMIAHEHKHYSNSGTGLRSLMDTYVYLRNKAEKLDWDYIRGEIGKLGLSDFEQSNRELALSVFSDGSFSDDNAEMLDYVISSGTYGTVQNRVKTKVRQYGGGLTGKLRYVLGRLFLPMATVREVFPFFADHPVLLPFLPVYRVLRGVIKRGPKLRAELKALGSEGKNRQ